MIKADMGSVHIRGAEEVVMAELTTILMSVRHIFTDNNDEEYADSTIDEAIKLSRMSLEEQEKYMNIPDMSMEKLLNGLDRILNKHKGEDE